MSKKLLAIMLAAVFMMTALVAGCGSSDKGAAQKDEKKVLKVGTNADFAPFEFQEKDGQYVGFDMDLIRALGKEMGYEVDIQNINFDGLVPGITANNFDVAISGMTINEERQKKVAFSKPYYQSGLTIAVKAENTAIKSFKDLEGKKIAVQIGTTSAKEAKKIKGAEVKEFNSSADTFTELNNNGVDAVINDRPVNDYYVMKNAQGKVKTLNEILTAEDYGIAMNKSNKDLTAKMDAALEKIKANGEYDKIFEKWFGKKSQ